MRVRAFTTPGSARSREAPGPATASSFGCEETCLSESPPVCCGTTIGASLATAAHCCGSQCYRAVQIASPAPANHEAWSGFEIELAHLTLQCTSPPLG